MYYKDITLYNILTKETKTWSNTRELAEEMDLSMNTVQNFLRGERKTLKCTWITKETFNSGVEIKIRKPRSKYHNWNSKTLCRRFAKKCKSKSEMYQRFNGAYLVSIKNGWIDEFFPESVTKRGKKFWTYETCKEEAKKYDNIKDFSLKSSRAYRVSLDNGWLDDFGFKSRQKMTWKKKIWTKEECAEIAKQCSGRIDFCKKKASAYRFAKAQGWLDEFFGFSKESAKKSCQETASRYKRSSQLKKAAPAVYKKCLYNGWLDEFYPNEVKEIPKNEKSIRTMILNYVEANGSQTKKDLYRVMLTIAGQNINRKAWGVCYLDNVSFGTSVFIPTKSDKRYLKMVRGFNPKEIRYDIAMATCD